MRNLSECFFTAKHATVAKKTLKGVFAQKTLNGHHP